MLHQNSPCFTSWHHIKVHQSLLLILLHLNISLPTCEGHTVICGCEWYQPSTRMGCPSSWVSLSAWMAAFVNCSGEISTRSFRLSERLSITTAEICATFLESIWKGRKNYFKYVQLPTYLVLPPRWIVSFEVPYFCWRLMEPVAIAPPLGIKHVTWNRILLHWGWVLYKIKKKYVNLWI
jgi:hypothetical protein